MSVLVTAFGRFDGGSNASQAVLRALEARPPVADRHFRLLPVDTVEAPRLLAGAIAECAPSFLLMLGQAAGRNRVTLERFAVNLRDFSVADESGARPRAVPVIADGPAAYRADWPDPDGAAAAIERAGIPAAVSNHAGTHLCNQLLYHALHASAAGPHRPRAIFLHLPVLPAQVIAGEPATLRHAACPFLPLDMAVRAVDILLARAAAAG